MENPFEHIAKELASVKARQNEILTILNNLPAGMIENPMCADDAAAMFGIAKQTLYQHKNKIKHKKRFGRLYFYPADIRAYIDGSNP